MSVFSQPICSILDPDSSFSSVGEIAEVLSVQGVHPYDRIGYGSMVVPNNADNVDLLEVGMVAYVYTTSAIHGNPMEITTFIIKKIEPVVSSGGGPTLLNVSGQNLIHELTMRNIAENIIANVITTTLASNATAEEVTTTLNATASGGSATVVVVSATGFDTGQPISVELDAGGRHRSTITGVAGTTITMADNLPSQAASGNDCETETGYHITVTSATNFVAGQPVFIELDSGVDHAATITDVSGTDITIGTGLPIDPDVALVATAGNDVVTHAVALDDIEQIMAYAPSNWNTPTNNTPNGSYIVGAGESVMEAIDLAKDQGGGHWRLRVAAAPIRELTYLDSPDTSSITDLVRPATADHADMTDDTKGIIFDSRRTPSDQFEQVTRIFARGAGNLGFTAAEDYISVAAGYTVDWEQSLITASLNESNGATRNERYVTFGGISPSGDSDAEILQAAINLYNTAFNWINNRQITPNFYNVTCVIHQQIKPFSYVQLTDAILDVDEQVVVHEAAYSMNSDDGQGLITSLKLGDSETWQDLDSALHVNSSIKQINTTLRHLTTGRGATASHASVSAAHHNPVSIGTGGLSSHLAITPSTQILTLSDIDYSEISNRQHDIVGADHTGTGSQFDVVGFTATDTLGTLTPSSNPGATEALLKTGSGGGVQLLRVGIGISPTVDNTIRMVDDAYIGIGGAAGRLAFEDDTTDLLRVYDGIFQAPMVGGGTTPTVAIHALATGNATAIQAEAPSLTSSPALSVQNIPLSSDVDTGKGIEVKVTSESFGRVMIYSDGKIGVGAGSSTRDTFLSRSAANTWLVSSNGGSGAGNIRFNNGAYAGLGPSAGRFVFVDAATDLVRLVTANFILNDGSTDRLTLRYSGDVDATESDIHCNNQGGISADSNFGIFIDANNDSTDARFAIFKNNDDFTNATEIMRVTEAGMMFINDTANGDGTIGLTINQGANDDDVLTAKSSDVATGVTGEAETDTFFSLRKQNATTGGARLMGLTEDVIAWQMRAIGTNTDTTSTTAGVAPALVVSALKSGTSVTTYGSTDNIFAVRNNNSTRFIVKGNGDIYYDGTANTYDEFDDVGLIRAVTLETASGGIIDSEFDRFINTNREQLEAMRLVSFNDDGHHFVNVTGMQRLQNGAIWQLHERIARLEEALL